MRSSKRADLSRPVFHRVMPKNDSHTIHMSWKVSGCMAYSSASAFSRALRSAADGNGLTFVNAAGTKRAGLRSAR
jgi:hypothetical protein